MNEQKVAVADLKKELIIESSSGEVHLNTILVPREERGK